VLTLVIAAAPNSVSVWVRVVDEVSDAVFEQEIAPRLFLGRNGDRKSWNGPHEIGGEGVARFSEGLGSSGHSRGTYR
jgi:hypothetical protein